GENLARLSVAIATHTHRIIFSADLSLSNLEERFSAAEIHTPEELERFAANRHIFDILRGMVAVSSDIDGLSIANAGGQVINSSRSWPPPNIDLSDREYFTALRDDPDRGATVLGTQINPATGQESLFLAHRISGADGAFLGVLVGSVAA